MHPLITLRAIRPDELPFLCQVCASTRQEELADVGWTVHVEQFNPAPRLYERLGFRKARDAGVYSFMERTPAPQPAEV